MTGDAFGLILMRRSPRKTYWTELVHRSARNAVRFGLRTVGDPVPFFQRRTNASSSAAPMHRARARDHMSFVPVLELELRRHGRRRDFIRRAFCGKDLWSDPAMVAPHRGLTDQNWNDHVAGGGGRFLATGSSISYRQSTHFVGYVACGAAACLALRRRALPAGAARKSLQPLRYGRGSASLPARRRHR